VATAGLVVILGASCSDRTADGPTMAYSELVQRASEGSVVAVVQAGTDLEVILSGETAPAAVTVSEQLNVWQELCVAAGTPDASDCAIRYEFREPSEAGSLLGLLISSLLPVLLIGSFIFVMMRRAQSAQTR
jgi:hypothetical protein